MSSIVMSSRCCYQAIWREIQQNKPNLYETEIARPIDLPDEWDVALNNISYLHNWKSFDKSDQFFLLRQPIEGVNSELSSENEKDQTDNYDLISNKRNFEVEWLTVHHKFYGATTIYQIY